MIRTILVIIIISIRSLKLHSQIKTNNREPIFFLDSIECNGLPLFDPQFIDNIQIENKVMKNGQVFINTKRNHKFNWIYLSTLAANYPKYKTSLFMINGEVLKIKKNTKIDSSFILRIERIDSKDLFVVGKKIKKMVIFNIITNTKANIEKSKQIHIRGTDDLSENTN